MKIIYAHGLDSSANSVKGVLLQQYCEFNHPQIEVIRPDLNDSPDEVFRRLCDYIEGTKRNNEDVIIMGSSLGGYFSTLVSNETGCVAVLLNPSTQPHVSLQRFVTEKDMPSNTVIYQTSGGWQITLEDLQWFAHHQLQSLDYPQRVIAFIKEGDELLDPGIATHFYKKQGAQVVLQAGGDHRMTDFNEQLPTIMNHIFALVS